MSVQSCRNPQTTLWSRCCCQLFTTLAANSVRISSSSGTSQSQKPSAASVEFGYRLPPGLAKRSKVTEYALWRNGIREERQERTDIPVMRKVKYLRNKKECSHQKQTRQLIPDTIENKFQSNLIKFF